MEAMIIVAVCTRKGKANIIRTTMKKDKLDPPLPKHTHPPSKSFPDGICCKGGPQQTVKCIIGPPPPPLPDFRTHVSFRWCIHYIGLCIYRMVISVDQLLDRPFAFGVSSSRSIWS